MLFSSWQFLFLFLPAALLVFVLIPTRLHVLRKAWLLAASLVFYGYWKVEYVPLLLLSIAFNYAIAEIISRSASQRRSRLALIAGVSANLLLLGYYKYTNFGAAFLSSIMRRELGRFDVVLPLAISFFTFTQIGYLADVYRDKKLHYGTLDYGLFVALFPHLIAGPIVRHWEVIPQFARRDWKATRADLEVGAAMFLLGLYKKVLLADSAAPYANLIYGAAEAGTRLTFFDGWLGTLAYYLQIYFDFSGYSDMAIGLARMFGIRFPLNFDSPYRAASIIDFWRRWHITFQRFLREYLYYPLGGNRCSSVRHAFNLMVTMLLSGLWHGAGWTFIVWGGLHGFYLLIAHRWRVFVKARGWVFPHWSYRAMCFLLTFAAVLFAWIFFRANSLTVALHIAASMTGRYGLAIPGNHATLNAPLARRMAKLGIRFVLDPAPAYSRAIAAWTLAVSLLIAWFTPNTQQLLRAHQPALEPVERPSRWRMPLNAISGLVLGGLFFGVLRSYYLARPNPFIYFHF